MIKAIVRKLIRHGIDQLNDGDPSFLLRLAAPDVELSFPGDNSWSTMFRPTHASRERHVTHRGIEECRAFADRFVEAGLHIDIEDILVNGMPWNLRVAIRATDHIAGSNGDEYNNRYVGFQEIRWGRLTSWEVYEDTERVSAWDTRAAHEVAPARSGLQRENLSQ